MATKPYRPSNGFEGDIFIEQFCVHCEHDREHRENSDASSGCQILCRSFAFNIGDADYPKEWVRDEGTSPGLIGGTGARCTAFVPEGQEITYRCSETKEMFS
jgi:hypothetical protein